MGHPRSEAESNYLAVQIGNRWQRLLSDGQIFNRFADFAAQESKIDRDKVVKRLRVFSSRDEAPTAFWFVLMDKFYEEGAHLGLRKYIEDGVTYHCPPQYFIDFKTLCQSAPSYEDTLSWVFRPDYLSGWIFAHVFCPGKKDSFKPEWPDALELRGERFLVSYYAAGSVHELSDAEGEEDAEECLAGYRSTHSLLCLMFGRKSPAAFDVSLDQYASECILKVVLDPYLGVSGPRFADAALQIAALCVDGGERLANRPFRTVVMEVLGVLAKDYSQLQTALVGDADYMHPMTYPMMPLSKKSKYASLMADFQATMKAVVIEHAEEIAAFAKDLEGEDHSLHLHLAPDVPDERETYSVEVVRQYLANTRIPQSMPLEAFEALRNASENLRGKPSKTIHVAPLKAMVRDRTSELSMLVEATGEFPVTGPLMIALIEVGQAYNSSERTDYGDLLYRNSSDRPWLMTPVKFSGETKNLEDIRNEFLAYCRIVTGR